MITADYAKECLEYHPVSGKLYWKNRPREHFQADHRWKTFVNNCAGKEAGNNKSTGYISIQIDGRRYMAHRLAWLIAHGRWPESDIDHINGVRTDNRLINLRKASRTDNAKNRAVRNDNTSGMTGVYWDKSVRKWKAEIWLNGKRKNIGRFLTYEDAAAKRKEAEVRCGYHENHGRRPPDILPGGVVD